MEKIDLEHFPTSESARKMLGYVSAGFYDDSYVGKWIFQVMGIEYDKALEAVSDLPAQFFPETATWGLMYHEVKWGLPVRTNLSYEERRRLIYQKRDCRAPITPYRMEQMLQNQTGMDIDVADANDPGRYGYVAEHPNIFRICVRTEGMDILLNYGKIEEMIDRVKQSHTTYFVEHRCEYDRVVEIYVGSVASDEYIEYEFELCQVNRDMERSAEIFASGVLDMAIFEEMEVSEIGKEPLNGR